MIIDIHTRKDCSVKKKCQKYTMNTACPTGLVHLYKDNRYIKMDRTSGTYSKIVGTSGVDLVLVFKL